MNPADPPLQPADDADGVVQSGAIADQLQRLSDIQERLADLADPGRCGQSDEAQIEQGPSLPADAENDSRSRRWSRRPTS